MLRWTFIIPNGYNLSKKIHKSYPLPGLQYMKLSPPTKKLKNIPFLAPRDFACARPTKPSSSAAMPHRQRNLPSSKLKLAGKWTSYAKMNAFPIQNGESSLPC